MANMFFNPFGFGNAAGNRGIQPHYYGAGQVPHDLNGLMQILMQFQQFFGMSGPPGDTFLYNQPGVGYNPWYGPQYGTEGQLPRGGQGTTELASLVEVGVYEQAAPGQQLDLHAQAVADVYRQHTDAAGTVEDIFEGELPPEQLDQPEEEFTPVESFGALETLVDGQSTDAFYLMSEEIVENVQYYPNQKVINGSLGFSRASIYEETFNQFEHNPALAEQALAENPQLADALNLDAGDLDNEANLRKLAVAYVDSRLDAEGSAFNEARAHYQQVTEYAADNGFLIVIAAGNDGNLIDEFPTAESGAELNFLAQSHHVIVVAASESNEASRTASFSSRGDGVYGPTLSADGTDIRVSLADGNYLVDGTSFSAPQVTAGIMELRQFAREHGIDPNRISFDDWVEILQESAIDTSESEASEGAGIFNLDGAREELLLRYGGSGTEAYGNEAGGGEERAQVAA